MREALKKLNDRHKREFSGTVAAIRSSRERTHRRCIMLSGVRLIRTGIEVADHMWFHDGKPLDGLSVGDRIQFTARVTAYLKGRDRSIDYRLTSPEDITVMRP